MNRTTLSGLLAVGILSSACSGYDDAPSSADPTVAETESAVTVAAPVTGHPRLWIRQDDVARLQSWATPSNPMYVNGLQQAVNAAITTYNTQFFPNGQANATWPDPGDVNWVAFDTEAYAELFAFMSLVDPSPTNRAAHGARARNLLMHVMNQAVLGADSSATPAPFRGTSFSTYNRANYWGEAFGLTVDWAYPYFSAADKATIQKVFLRWSSECLNASTTAQEHPQPVGAINSAALLGDLKQLRWAANNYYTGHMRDLTLMSLALDPADDPPVNPALPVTQVGNSMRGYLQDVLGAWLYQQYAVYTDAPTAAAALSVPATGLGVASGGLSAEGFLYGESLGGLHEALLALHTAGYDDPSLAGPQAALVQSPFWDRFILGFLHSVAPVPSTPTDPNYSFMGPVYSMASYGDVLNDWIGPEFVTPFATLGIFDQTTGNTARLQTLRWVAQNVLQGGASHLYDRAGNVWGNSYATQSILYFMLFDPAAAAPADPRPGQPLVFTDKAVGRVLARTDWTPNATWFDYLCNWETINHQVGSANEFELWRKGEWLTKERTGYSDDFVFATSDYHNTLGVQNSTPSNLEWFEGPTSARGGQWINGDNAGDPTMRTSSGTGWVYAYGDATNLYNRPGPSVTSSAMDVTHVSRSIVWLQPDHVVVYDRATTMTANRFKRFNLTLLTNPAIADHTATVTSAGGQRLTIQTLLPATATLTASAAENFDRVADLEPTAFRLVVQDPSGPADVRFLHVLEAADAGVPVGTMVAVQSSAGTPFQGAAVAGAVVMFPVTPSAPFTGTTYVAPTGATMQIVGGLTPGAGYTVNTQATSGGTLVIVTPGGSSVADAGGVLLVGGASMSPPVCAYVLSSATAAIAAAGGSSSASVTAGAGCAWTAQSNASWITVTGGSSGTGSGVVAFSVTANTATTARTGVLTIAGQTLTVTQAAAAVPCTFTLSASSASIAAAGGSSSASVTAGAGCAWTAQSNASWISVTSGGSGTGSGAVTFSVAANTATTARTGTLTIAGQTLTVTQAAAAATCTFALSTSSASIAAAGGSSSASVTAGAGCSWTAQSSVSWISVTSGSSGAGNGAVAFSVAANTATTARTATLTIAGKTFTVTQAAAVATVCSYALPTSTASFAAAGGSGALSITTTSGCSWTGSSGASWIWLMQPITGSGSGSIQYSVQPNTTGATRTGTVAVGGKTFTVTQTAGASTTCSYALAVTAASFPVAGGSGTLSITTTSGCSWTGNSGASWIWLMQPITGSGNGSIQYSVQPNTTGATRTGTVAIGNATLTVTQNGK